MSDLLGCTCGGKVTSCSTRSSPGGCSTPVQTQGAPQLQQDLRQQIQQKLEQELEAKEATPSFKAQQPHDRGSVAEGLSTAAEHTQEPALKSFTVGGREEEATPDDTAAYFGEGCACPDRRDKPEFHILLQEDRKEIAGAAAVGGGEQPCGDILGGPNTNTVSGDHIQQAFEGSPEKLPVNVKQHQATQVGQHSVPQDGWHVVPMQQEGQDDEKLQQKGRTKQQQQQQDHMHARQNAAEQQEGDGERQHLCYQQQELHEQDEENKQRQQRQRVEPYHQQKDEEKKEEEQKGDIQEASQGGERQCEEDVLKIAQAQRGESQVDRDCTAASCDSPVLTAGSTGTTRSWLESLERAEFVEAHFVPKVSG